MKAYPGIVQKVAALLRSFRAMSIPIHAASTGFFVILSIFPGLLLLLSLLRYAKLDIHALVALLEGVFPQALLPEMERLILNTYQSTSGAVVSASAIIALWSASRGLHGLLKGLNAVYAVTENRGYFYTRLISVSYTFAFLLVLLLTLLLHVFGTKLLLLLENASSPFLRFLTDVIDLRFFLLVFLQAGLFTAMFMVLPNRKNSLSDSLPGALFSAIGWLVFSQLYSLYVDYFPSYSGIYGPIYGIALSMLWLYCCICIVFYGGALNFLLMQREGK